MCWLAIVPQEKQNTPLKHILCYIVNVVVPIQASLKGHLAALTKSHLIGDHPSSLTKEQTTETMDPVALKQKGCNPIPTNEI